MPNENIERAITRDSGEGPESTNFEELIYESYAPGGVAVLIEIATDDKNRTAADLRLIFSKNHGNLGASGSVAYMFKRRGQITVSRHAFPEDQRLEAALKAGAEDVNSDEEHHVITTAHDRLYAVTERLKVEGVVADSQKLTYIPENTIPIVDEGLAAEVVRLCDALEDNDDVQHVHANFGVPDDWLARLSA